MPTINMQILGVDNPVAVELGIVDLCTYVRSRSLGAKEKDGNTQTDAKRETDPRHREPGRPVKR
jgi:hypothetical protein